MLAQADLISAFNVKCWNMSITAQSHECMCIPGCIGDTQFSFRLRQSVGRSSSWFGQEDVYNKDAPVTLQVRNRLALIKTFPSITSDWCVLRTNKFHKQGVHVNDHTVFQKEHAHLHGYVYFRQVKDASVKRGYFQKVCNWNERYTCLSQWAFPVYLDLRL